MKYLFFLFLIVTFVITIIFSTQNDQQITLNYILSQGEYRVSSVLIVLFSVGFIIGLLVSGVYWLKARILLSYAKRKIKKLERNIDLLSNVPVNSHISVMKK